MRPHVNSHAAIVFPPGELCVCALCGMREAFHEVYVFCRMNCVCVYFHDDEKEDTMANIDVVVDRNEWIHIQRGPGIRLIR